jgi:hypothetical protein
MEGVNTDLIATGKIPVAIISIHEKFYFPVLEFQMEIF